MGLFRLDGSRKGASGSKKADRSKKEDGNGVSLTHGNDENTLQSGKQMSKRKSWFHKKEVVASSPTTDFEDITEQVLEDDERQPNSNLMSLFPSVSGQRQNSKDRSLIEREGTADFAELKLSKDSLSDMNRNGSKESLGSSSRQNSVATPILQLPSGTDDDIIYRIFLSGETHEVQALTEGFSYTSVNEPWLAFKYGRTGASPKEKEIKMSKEPIAEFSRGRVVKVIAADDLLVEVIPQHIPADIMDAFSLVVSSRLSNTPSSTSATSAAMLEKEGYTIKSNGNIAKTFRVRLRGTMAPSPEQEHCHESLKFVERTVTGHRVTVKVYGVDAYGRAIADLTMVKIQKLLSKSLIKVGMVWHYPLLDLDDELAEIMVEAQGNKRGIWSLEGVKETPWEVRARGL